MIQVEIAADWRENPPPDTFVATGADAWTISLPETDAASRLAAELARVPNARLLSLSGTTLAVLVLLVPISLFAVLGNGIYDLILDEQPSARLILVVLASLLAYVVLAAIAARSKRMSLLSQELGEMVDGFRDMTHRFHLRPARIMRQARAWARLRQLDKVRRIDVWNPGLASTVDQAEVFWDILLPLFREHLTSGSRLRLHVRNDEMTGVCRALEAQSGIKLQVIESASRSAGETAPITVLNAGELRLLHLMRVASFPLQQLMRCPLSADSGPACFSENAFLRLTQHFATDLPQDFVYRFLARCRNDYAYLDPHPDQIEILCLSPALAAAIAPEASQLAAQARQLLLSDPRRFVHDGDPTTLLYTINGLAVLHDQAADSTQVQQSLRQQMRLLVGETITGLDRGEHYPLFAHLARQEFADGPGAGQIARRLPRVIADHTPLRPVAEEVQALTRFNAFSPDILARLARLLEVSGYYAAASAIWDKLRNLDPLPAGIRLARLRERQGDARGGLAIIRPILACNSLAQRPDIHVAALLEAAWLNYSTGDSSLLAQGFAWLDTVGQLMERHPGEAEACWRYHNYRALYLDADGRQAEAIAENRMALAIPGIQLKWYSGSLTNLAYVSRKYGLKQRQADTKHALTLIAESIEYATLAVDLKRRIADIDELPVALHNLALAHLCRALLTDPQSTNETAQQARTIIDEGLSLLERTGSSKKRFALQLENALACGLLDQDWRTALARAREAPASERELACAAGIEQHEDGFAALCAAVLDLEILD
ncbi:hypothetical protein [Azonexus hydrophilus]|uniref:hypothetical protein n=1 Tax=Azonexus hydrophilus TaxID=418702 RepID=UPI00040F4F00|nr:hypothetical protein [Azonexus hydrophilus]